MIQHIVSPVDFSKGCEIAARHAGVIAKQFQAELVYLHVISGPAPDQSVAKEQDDIYEARMTAFLENVGCEEPCRHVLLRGDPVDEIEKYCRDQSADLVVVPTRGHGKFRTLLIGSVTAKILHDLACPIFTGSHFEDRDETPAPYRHIACAIDWSDAGEEVLKWAWEFSRHWNTRLTAIHAVPVVNYGYERSVRARSEKNQELIDSASACMNEMMDRLRCTGVVEVGVGGVTDVVSSIAKKVGADLLIVGRGEAKARSSRLPTHTYGLVRAAPCPVISV